jgi:hypothetical protein
VGRGLLLARSVGRYPAVSLSNCNPFADEILAKSWACHLHLDGDTVGLEEGVLAFQEQGCDVLNHGFALLREVCVEVDDGIQDILLVLIGVVCHAVNDNVLPRAVQIDIHPSMESAVRFELEVQHMHINAVSGNNGKVPLAGVPKTLGPSRVLLKHAVTAQSSS